MTIAAWPQYVIVGILTVNFVCMLIKDNMKSAARDRAISFVASIVVYTGNVSILWAGGFWAPLGWPS